MWAQVINAILGIWLMACPAIYGTGTTISNNQQIVGPVIASFAIISWWESTRVVRLYNVPLGLWLIIAPWVLGYDHSAATINDMVVGALVAGLSFVQGKIEERFGGGWAAIWEKNPIHAQEARNKPRQ